MVEAVRKETRLSGLKELYHQNLVLIKTGRDWSITLPKAMAGTKEINLNLVNSEAERVLRGI